VDFNSDDGLAEWIQGNFQPDLEDGTLQFYQLLERHKFSISTGKNFSHRLARGEVIINLDADNFVDGLAEAGKAMAKGQVIACEEFHKGIHGRIGFWREDLQRLNGYDEEFEPAGHQDMDILERAVRLGVKKRHVPCATDPIQHAKSETMAHAGGGDFAAWRQMEQRNRSRSWTNLGRGICRANGRGLTAASFLHNFRHVCHLNPDSYFYHADEACHHEDTWPGGARPSL
jgi:N-terminal domain of galactosyltransferase